MTASFSNLSLAEPLARAVAEMGYESMTPIQAEAIPVVLTGKDVMGAAQTGTGKTAAFSLPLLQRLLKQVNPRGKNAEVSAEDFHSELMDELSRAFESAVIKTTLKVTRGRRIDAAVRLGIGRNTITRKIQELRLEAD